jgi:hypothetical protein
MGPFSNMVKRDISPALTQFAERRTRFVEGICFGAAMG